MASLAQMERELVTERTRAGLAVAKKLGRAGGRKRRMTDGKVESAKKLLAGGYATPRRCPKSRGNCSYAVPLAPGLRTGLAYKNIRF
jgi:DNA invertase Pin-like site-specific DNA recombinase